jgi:hypothetical protein
MTEAFRQQQWLSGWPTAREPVLYPPGTSELIKKAVDEPSEDPLGFRGRDRPVFADRAAHSPLQLAA